MERVPRKERLEVRILVDVQNVAWGNAAQLGDAEWWRQLFAQAQEEETGPPVEVLRCEAQVLRREFDRG